MVGTVLGVEAAFASDWHVGVGYGRRGSVDRAIAVDADGLPFVPAKTAVGILRDAAEIAANALDSGSAGVWGRWVEAVFGSQPARSTSSPPVPPRPAALLSAPLQLAAPVRRFLLTAPTARTGGRVLTRADLVAATRVVRAGVKIDPATGTAEPETFRHTERARAGLSVHAEFELIHPEGAVVWPAQLLLAAAARLVRSLGGDRRRGAGAVTLTLTGLPELAVLRALHDNDDVPEPWPLPHPGTDPIEDSATAGTSGYGAVTHRADLVITVRRPVIVDGSTWGNEVRTNTFVPGSLLLPLLAPALAGRLGELVRAGAVVVTDATLDLGGRPGWAWPRALTQSKDAAPGSVEFVNRLHSHVLDPRLRPAVGRYLHPDGERAGRVEVSERIHAVIDDDRQRPTSEGGGLFVYHGIAPGTRLRAQLYLPAGVDLDAEQLAGSHRIGRSAKDDYGLIDLAVTEPSPTPAPSAIPAGGEFTVWVGSQTLLRNPRGGYDTSPQALAAALGRALGVPGAIRLADPADTLDEKTGLVTGREPSQVGVVRREGWQRRWGLARPSLTGIAAGSTLLCLTSAALDPGRIAALQTRGVGERTSEGFGRLLLDAAALAHPRATITTATPAAPDELAGVEAIPDSVLLSAAWHTAITTAAITTAAATHTDYLAPGLGRAQLGDLRVVLDDLDQPHGVDAARTWLATADPGSGDGGWGAQRLARIDALLTSDPAGTGHPLWPLLFATTPTDLPESEQERAVLSVYAVQVTLTEMLRAAGATRPETAQVQA